MGCHLMIDAYDCDRDKLNDIDYIRTFLNSLPLLIDMTIIMPPKLMDYKAPILEEEGITGFTVIAESHISIHTYPRRDFFAFDCFSCNEFDIEKTINYVQQYFNVGHLVPQFEHRGFEARLIHPEKVITYKKKLEVKDGGRKRLLLK